MHKKAAFIEAAEKNVTWFFKITTHVYINIIIVELEKPLF